MGDKKWCNPGFLTRGDNQPIRKKGAYDEPANYWLITLLDMSSKIYAQMLLMSLKAWAFGRG